MTHEQNTVLMYSLRFPIGIMMMVVELGLLLVLVGVLGLSEIPEQEMGGPVFFDIAMFV